MEYERKTFGKYERGQTNNQDTMTSLDNQRKQQAKNQKILLSDILCRQYICLCSKIVTSIVTSSMYTKGDIENLELYRPFDWILSTTVYHGREIYTKMIMMTLSIP